MLSHFYVNEKALKTALRKKLLDRRKNGVQNNAGPAFRLLASDLWRSADIVALYVSLPEEASTLPLLRDAWQTGKNVYLPRITSLNRHEMAFYACGGPDELHTGPYGLREPGGNELGHTVELLILPGVGFDRQGNRLGYGGGYYDRFLRQNPDFAQTRLGLCHDCQIMDNLPHDCHDIPVQGICAESGLKWF